MTFEQLNALPHAEFIAYLGDLYEHSPWVVAAVADKRPFKSIDELLTLLNTTLMQATPAQQLALMRAHPELAGRAAVDNQLTEESTKEQATAGLKHCTPEQFAKLQNFNDTYQKTFGWPFIVAVTGLTVDDILANMQERLTRSKQQEWTETLQQIQKIAGIRLAQRLQD